VNRKDAHGRNLFQGGFLGLDNIGIFDRSAPLPTGGHLDQADGTSWMAMYSLDLMRIALELARHNHVYEDIATKFFEHFLSIAGAMINMADEGLGLWCDNDKFYYDVLNLPNGDSRALRIRSLVGLIPLFAVEVLDPALLDEVPAFKGRLEWYLSNRPELAELVSHWEIPGAGARRLLSLLRGHRMKRLLRRMLDETEFLSPYGIRALSRHHLEHPYEFNADGIRLGVRYEPAESSDRLFGGNSNWRGPIWMPVNFLLIESLQKFHHYYGDDFKVECPTGSGEYLTLEQIAAELGRRLTRLFLKDETGERPVLKYHPKLAGDPHFKDLVLFHEYFHGDNGRGVGASHQTGWTSPNSSSRAPPTTRPRHFLFSARVGRSKVTRQRTRPARRENHDARESHPPFVIVVCPEKEDPRFAQALPLRHQHTAALTPVFDFPRHGRSVRRVSGGVDFLPLVRRHGGHLPTGSSRHAAEQDRPEARVEFRLRQGQHADLAIKAHLGKLEPPSLRPIHLRADSGNGANGRNRNANLRAGPGRNRRPVVSPPHRGAADVAGHERFATGKGLRVRLPPAIPIMFLHRIPQGRLGPANRADLECDTPQRRPQRQRTPQRRGHDAAQPDGAGESVGRTRESKARIEFRLGRSPAFEFNPADADPVQAPRPVLTLGRMKRDRKHDAFRRRLDGEPGDQRVVTLRGNEIIRTNAPDGRQQVNRPGLLHVALALRRVATFNRDVFSLHGHPAQVEAQFGLGQERGQRVKVGVGSVHDSTQEQESVNQGKQPAHAPTCRKPGPLVHWPPGPVTRQP
jgi:hypothetical protein